MITAGQTCGQDGQTAKRVDSTAVPGSELRKCNLNRAKEKAYQEAIDQFRSEGWAPPPLPERHEVDWARLGLALSECVNVYLFTEPPLEWFEAEIPFAFDYEGKPECLVICACAWGVAIESVQSASGIRV